MEKELAQLICVSDALNREKKRSHGVCQLSAGLSKIALVDERLVHLPGRS